MFFDAFLPRVSSLETFRWPAAVKTSLVENVAARLRSRVRPARDVQFSFQRENILAALRKARRVASELALAFAS